MKSIYFYNFTLCRIGIAEDDGSICRVFFNGDKASDRLVKSGFYQSETPLIKKAAKQLGEYFDGKRKTFDLPLAPRGTEFQLTVWKALQTISYGKTCSYGQLAAMIGNPKACRAVGMANNRNPIAVIIPCHRVIGSNGSLTGYAGGLELKEKLILLEKN